MAELPTLRDPMPFVVESIEDALSEAWVKRQRDRAGTPSRLPLSQVGGCQRKVWYGLQATGEPSPPETTLLHIFDYGNAVEDYVVRLLRMAGYEVEDVDPDTGEQWRVEDHDGRVSGRLDGKITYGLQRRKALLEIKSANANQYRKLQDVGVQAWNPKYISQVTYYMGLAELDHCVFVVLNKNQFYLGEGTWKFSVLHVEKVRFDNKRYEQLRLKALDIVNAESCLARPELGKSQYCGFCKYCDVNEWCWSPTRGVKFDE
jgi:hypothetical protein